MEKRASTRLYQTQVAPSEQGLTLIECLVAIVVIAIAVSAITPALVISVATRIQSQKAEQALALAQSKIEDVRLIIERGDYGVADLPKSTPITTYPTVSHSTPGNMVAPTVGSVVPSTTLYKDIPVTAMRREDIDGDGIYDYAVQIYRTQGKDTSSGVPVAFGLGVRVYDYTYASTATSLLKDPARLGFTSGQGERQRRPLAALYTTVIKGDGVDTYCSYFQHVKPSATTSTPFGCN